GAGDLVGGDGHGGCSFGVVCAGLWVTGQVCSGRAVVITGVPEPGQGLPGGPWRRRRPSRVMRWWTVQWGQAARVGVWGGVLGLSPWGCWVRVLWAPLVFFRALRSR